MILYLLQQGQHRLVALQLEFGQASQQLGGDLLAQRVQPEFGGFAVGAELTQAIAVGGQQIRILAQLAGQILPDRAQGFEGVTGSLEPTGPGPMQQIFFLFGGQLAHLVQHRDQVDEGRPVLAGQMYLTQLIQHHGVARVEGIDGFQHGQRSVVLALLNLQLGLGQGQCQLGLGVLLLRFLQVLIPAYVVATGLGGLGGTQVVEQRGIAVAGALEHQLLGLAVVTFGHGQCRCHRLLVGLAAPARTVPAQCLAAQTEYPAQQPFDDKQGAVEQHGQDHGTGD